MAIGPRGFGARRRSRPLGEVTIVAPVDEASAIGHALTLRRPLRLERSANARLRRRRHADRLRQHRHHAGLQAAAGSGRVGHQQGLEPRRRRDLFGDGGGRARRRRCSACRASRCRCGRRAATTTSRTRRSAAASLAEALLARPLPPRTFLNINVPQGPAEGDPRHGAGASGTTSRRSPSGTIRRGGRTSGSRKGRTTGSRTIGRTTRRCATATCR